MKYSFLFLLFVTLWGCSDKEEQKTPPNWDMKKSTDFNKELALEEDLDINLFLAQHEKWVVDTTGSGLRVVWFKRTEGALPKSGQNAKVHYKISLLDGTQVYETEPDKLDVFRVDNSEMESGIHEGIKLMRVGEKAIRRFVEKQQADIFGPGRLTRATHQVHLARQRFHGHLIGIVGQGTAHLAQILKHQRFG